MNEGFDQEDAEVREHTAFFLCVWAYRRAPDRDLVVNASGR
jgi:hypothetical protein